jgi:signal transduction histidine kinase
VERRLAALEREKRIVDALYRVGRAVAREHDLHEIVQLVTDETTALVGAQLGAFFYNEIGEDGRRSSLHTISGVSRSRFERFPEPRESELFRLVFEGTASVRLADVTADPRFGRRPPFRGLPPGHPPVRSFLAVPVLAADGSIEGALVFGHEDVGVFDEEDERIADGIATQAGTAIVKARLLDAERRARAEAEARAHAAHSLDHVSDGVVMVDRDGRILLWNGAAARIVGLASDEAVGRRLGEALPAWERIAPQVPVGRPDAPTRPSTLPLDAPAGELWLSLYGIDFGDGTVYAFRDVTDEQRLEELRSDLIATVSHEIRTPVAAVYGAARTLERGGLDDDVRERLLAVLVAESERLAGLVDEILLAGSLDAGWISLSAVELDLAALASHAAASGALAGDRTRIEVELPRAPVEVVADPDRTAQVLANLLENAAKYGGGEVALRVCATAGAGRVEIADNGPGVPADEQDRIFEKFHRLDAGDVRGTGLGLYICRELVARMDGRIGVDSAPGEGATFWFELPLSASR